MKCLYKYTVYDEVKSLYINVKMLITVNVLPTPYQKEKRLKNLKIPMSTSGEMASKKNRKKEEC
jgi:hypothetical protein